MSSPEDKRSYTRIPVKVKIFINEGEGEGLLYFYTSNISIGGVFIISDLLLESETKLQLEFQIPGTNVKVKSAGVVRWQQDDTDTRVGFMPPGMGIQFLNLDPFYRQAIEEFIAKHIRRVV